jgi:predicted CXXCH cytochrome family protein
MDVCAACHARRTQLKEHSFSNEHFNDVYALELPNETTFYPDGQIKDEVFEIHSFQQSKMYSKGVLCTDCHAPHTGKLISIGNALCIRCHKAEVFNNPIHHHHPVQSNGAACVNCHMPGKMYMQKHFRRDHSIRIPRPDLSLQHGTPNACTQCHQNKSNAWAAQTLLKWYPRGPRKNNIDLQLEARTAEPIQLEKIIAYLKDQTQAEVPRAFTLLALPLNVSGLLQNRCDGENTPLMLQALLQKGSITDFSTCLQSRHTSVQIHAARALWIQNQPIEDQHPAQKAWEKMLLFGSDNPTICLDLANLRSKQKRYTEALFYYQKSLKIDRQEPMIYVNMAETYRLVGKTDSANYILQKGLSFVTQKDLLYYALAMGCVQLKQYNDARSWLLKAHSFEKQNLQYLLALALVEKECLQKKKALQYVDELIRRSPSIPAYKNLRLEILSIKETR